MRLAAPNFSQLLPALAFATVLAALPGQSAHAAGALNDTGITFCADETTNTASCASVASDTGAYPRQDARYGRDAAAAAGQLSKIGGGEAGFDFTALDAAGNPTTPTAGATPHPCVRDNVTGLVWEVKTADGGLRDQQWSYTWFDSVHNYGGNQGTANGGDRACKTSGRCDTEKYVADVNATRLCGFADWRMPSVYELESIVHLGRSNPAIDPAYFPNTLSSRFWSGSPVARGSFDAWWVRFSDGLATGGTYRTEGFAVRSVRGGQ